jgi:hypothetical protein
MEVWMEFGKLVPQILFDILTRFVPGAVLLCSWIAFLGQDDWRRLLDALLGGNLHDDNALPVSMLALLFLSFLLGYLLAPFTRGVQRLNEAPPLVTKMTRRRWFTNDPDAEARYDWLRAHQPSRTPPPTPAQTPQTILSTPGRTATRRAGQRHERALRAVARLGDRSTAIAAFSEAPN